MSLGYIGPIKVIQYNPTVSSSASPTAQGLRSVSFGGLFQWDQAQALQELLDNPARRITIAGQSGVLEYVYCDDDLLGPSRGWYLLESADLSASQPESLGGITRPVGASVKGLLIGDGTNRQLVLTRSSRQRDAVATSGVSFVPSPLWAESVDRSFAVEPGGGAGTREYDSAYPYAGAAAATKSRQLGFRVGSISGETESIANVIVPAVDYATDYGGSTVPRWVSDRGSDVQVYNRRLARPVYGPRHPFVAPTDVLIGNGLVRFWPGPAGLLPYLNVQAFSGGVWRDCGTVSVEADPNSGVLIGVRLVAATAEGATLALTTLGAGESFVILRRGERMIRCQLGGTRPPTVSTVRSLRWRGTPPPLRADTAVLGVGRFGNGISIASGDISFTWPASVPKTGWGYCGWWTPSAASSAQADSGLLSIMDSLAPVSTVKWVAGSKTIQWTQNGQTVSSAALTFALGTPVFWCVRHSSAGRVLSTYVLGGAVAHVSQPTYTNPGTTDPNYRAFALGVVSSVYFGFGNLGSNAFGSGTQANGVLDTNMVFEGGVTDAEVGAMAVASSPLGALPAPEAKLVMYLPLDQPPTLPASPMTSGRRYETTPAGARASDYTRTVLADSPRGWWRLGETSGTTAADSSGNAINGTYTGGFTLGQRGVVLDDQALVLDGVAGSYVAVPNNSPLNITADLSIAAWAYTTDVGVKIIFAGSTLSVANDPGYCLAISASGGAGVLSWWDATANAWRSSTGTINDGRWHHVVAALTGSTLRFYIDAALDSTVTGVNPPTSRTGVRSIGSHTSGVFYNWAGGLDEVAVFASGLTAGRVQAHYAAGIGAYTRGVAVLGGSTGPADGLGVTGGGTSFDAAAILATRVPLDDLADHHAQFAAENQQSLRIR